MCVHVCMRVRVCLQVDVPKCVCEPVYAFVVTHNLLHNLLRYYMTKFMNMFFKI